MTSAQLAKPSRKQRVRTLWISDVHLGTRDCQAEHLAAFLVHVERLGLSPGAIERKHELRAQPLTERMLGDERAELADERRVVSQLELGLDPLLLRFEPELVEPRDLGLGEVRVPELRQSGASPECERLVEHP